MANGFTVTPLDYDEDVTSENNSGDQVSLNELHVNEDKESFEKVPIYDSELEALKAKYGIALETVKDLPNPLEYLDRRIQVTYNTSAITAIELIDTVGKENSNLHLEFFGEVCLSLICQVSEGWVQLMMKHCLHKWENNDVVSGYVTSYLHCEHPEMTLEELDEERKKLIDILPDSIRNEDSPDLYKEYKAVELLLQKSHDDYDTQTFETQDDVIEYCASFEGYIDDDVPYTAANAQASEDFVQAREHKSIGERSGKLIGRVIKFKYDTAKSFEDAMRDSLGEYADVYFDNRDTIKQRKQQLKEERRAYRDELKLKREEMQHQAKLSEMELKQRERAQQEFMNRSYNNRYNPYSRDKHTYPRDISDDDEINKGWIIAFIALAIVIVFLFKGCVS